MNIFLIVDKETELPVGQGALYTVVAIAMVFVILLIIIGITSLIFKLTGLFDLKKELDAKKEQKIEQPKVSEILDKEDEDMMAAILVATIDYQNEIKKDVRVVNVKRID